jgi:AcrR family transcriptional regulator
VKAIAGHRERKKQRTREQIVESAFALFRERGFQATTVADIAAAADIAPRTFFAYFPSKEAVVFYDFDGLFASLKETIEGRPEDETAIDALRRWLDVSLPL